jgi:hypothetical protein
MKNFIKNSQNLDKLLESKIEEIAIAKTKIEQRFKEESNM